MIIQRGQFVNAGRRFPAEHFVRVAGAEKSSVGKPVDFAHAAFGLLPGVDRSATRSAASGAATGAPLPPAWRVDVDVLNGSGDINFTRRVASRIGSIGYRIHHVGRANRFDYPRTAVYYEPGGQRLAVRLARQIGVVTMPLPNGRNPRRLVVIVGPHKGPG